MKIFYSYSNKKVFLWLLPEIKQNINPTLLQAAFYFHLKFNEKRFSTFCNGFFYTQPTFVFQFQENYFIFHDRIVAFRLLHL